MDILKHSDWPTNELIPSQESCIAYIESACQKLLNAGFHANDFQSVDHIGIRVNWVNGVEGTYNDYQLARDTLANFGKIISEAIIPMNETGRPISIIQLSSPIAHLFGETTCIEIPAPRLGYTESVGIDHIEVVIKMSLADFVSKYKSILLAEGVDEVKINEAQAKAPEGGINSDITVQLGSHKVKFHTKSIEEVIEEEQSGLTLLDKLAAAFKEKNPGIMI